VPNPRPHYSQRLRVRSMYIPHRGVSGILISQVRRARLNALNFPTPCADRRYEQRSLPDTRSLNGVVGDSAPQVGLQPAIRAGGHLAVSRATLISISRHRDCDCRVASSRSLALLSGEIAAKMRRFCPRLAAGGNSDCLARVTCYNSGDSQLDTNASPSLLFMAV
jgi:hypothetical protein